MLSSFARWVAFALVLGCALALRTCELSRRPMHTDEANQAVKTGELLETGDYRFDPHDHHGPTLYYFGALAARARGERTLAELNETTVRLVPALFGVGCVVLIGLLVEAATGGATVHASDVGRDRLIPPSANRRSPTGRASRRPVPSEALLAAAFLTVCPAAVYYARYYIQETLLLAFVLLTILAAAQWVRSGRIAWTLLVGASVGCALATKETALLYFAAAGVATWVTLTWAPQRPASEDVCGNPGPLGDRPLPRTASHVIVMVTLAGLVAAGFYSSFGRNLGGLRDGMVAPLVGLSRAAGPTGHEKPWWYYLGLLTWQRNGELVWQQMLLVALAMIGAIAGWRRMHVRWTAVYTATVLIALSAVPYKTPWNGIHVVPGLAVLAAAAVIAMAALRTGRVVAAAFTFLTLATLLAQTYRAAFRYGADARNPYAYVHSAPDVTKFRTLVVRALADDKVRPIRVISPEYWPLPWYLRGLPRIGYWSEPPADCDGALVIAAADLRSEVRSRLHGNYREQFLGLRPGFAMIVFVPERMP